MLPVKTTITTIEKAYRSDETHDPSHLSSSLFLPFLVGASERDEGGGSTRSSLMWRTSLLSFIKTSISYRDGHFVIFLFIVYHILPKRAIKRPIDCR